jgi:threonine dehydratase
MQTPSTQQVHLGFVVTVNVGGGGLAQGCIWILVDYRPFLFVTVTKLSLRELC